MPAATKHDDKLKNADKRTTPEKVQRHCTDLLCALIFLAALVALGGGFVYGATHSDPEKFVRLPTFWGEICGVSDNVVDKPYLYLCLDNGTVDYHNAVCVSNCSVPECKLNPYSAHPFLGVCVPDDAATKEIVRHTLATFFDSMGFDFGIAVESVMHGSKILAGSAVFAFIAAYVYLFLIQKCALVMFWVGFGLLVVGLGGTGAVLLLSDLDKVDNLAAAEHQGLSVQTGGGLVSCLLCFVAICYGCCNARSINKAITCLSAAADCIEHTPLLLVLPVSTAIVKGIVGVVLLVGLLLLLASGNGITVNVHEGFSTEGLELNYSNELKVIIAVYAFVSLWVIEYLTAVSSFMVAFMTQAWFFNTGKFFSFCNALCAACTKHMGTLAYGSFCISTTRAIRLILEYATQAFRDTQNPVGQAITCCCACLVACFERFLRQLTDFAYMDVAINSNNFCTAALHAMTVFASDATEVAILAGSCLGIKVMGLLGITATGGLLAYVVAISREEYTDPASAEYVALPLPVAGIAAFICLLIAEPFMHVFGYVADTILFCHALEKTRTPEEDDEGSQTSCSLLEYCCKSPKTAPPSRHGERTQRLLDEVTSVRKAGSRR